MLLVWAAVDAVEPQVPLSWPAPPKVSEPAGTFTPEARLATVPEAMLRLPVTESPDNVIVPPPVRFRLEKVPVGRVWLPPPNVKLPLVKL